MSGSDFQFFIPVAIGFVAGIIIGEIATQVLFPEFFDAIANAFVVEGSWKDVQDSSYETIRIAADMLFGLGGAVSLLAIVTFFEG